MYLSKLAHVFVRGKTICLYHALNHEVRFFDENVWMKIKMKFEGYVSSTEPFKFQNELNDLIRAGFVVRNHDSDKQTLLSLRKEFAIPKINVLYLLLAEGCNIDCSYCFFAGNFSRRPEINPMSWELAKKAIDFYAEVINRQEDEAPEKNKLINFYGGEPMLNRKVFERSVSYISNLSNKGVLPKGIRMSVNTNGTIMDRSLAEFISRHSVEIGVSIDGPKDIHDQCRKYANGQGTFHQAVAAYQILKEAGANVGVSCTISENTVGHLPDIFEWLIDELEVTGMGFNPLIECRRFQVSDKDYSNRVAHDLIKCYQIARERGVYEDRMMRKVKAFVGGYFYERDCSAIGRQMVFGPNGTVGICPTYYASGKYFVDFTPDFDPLVHPIWIEWLERIPINMPQCFDCEAIGICGGGCPFNAHTRHGDIWQVDDFFCAHSKATLNWLIWDLFDRME